MNSESNDVLVVITGPTCVGKTLLSIEIARTFSAEILSADSRQFYREMKIGTARPSDDILSVVPHHFIGHLSIRDHYNVSRFETDVITALPGIFKRSSVALLVGGSGLYINAVCHGIDELPDPDDATRRQLKEVYLEEGIIGLQRRLKDLDPLYFKEVDRSNPNRMLRAIEVCMTTGRTFSELRKNKPVKRDFRIIKVGLQRDREDLNGRINMRVEGMMEEGLLEEVRNLLPYRDLNALNTVGYKELFAYLDGKCSLGQAVEKIKTSTRRFAKRQMTWFRKDREINWFHPGGPREIVDFLKRQAR